MRNFRKLRVYDNALNLSVEIYSFLKGLPKNEGFGLKSQLRRAVTSVSLNISEGASRESEKHFKLFLQTALGSVYEVET